jgi:ribosomal protein S18 acetylase RimI-like enzyme
MHPLDNIIWQALTTRQAHFAESFQSARRFPREVSPLCAFEVPNDDGYGSLTGLVNPGVSVGVFLNEPYEPRAAWDYVVGAPLLQMVYENEEASFIPPRTSGQIVELGTPDSPEMLALTALTKPGPFGTRTHELGLYVGIRDQDRLVAMAGERLKVPAYTEVSAVCTHPDHLGKGYAGILMIEVMKRIRARGETPFLHVRSDNARAIGLYQRLGFTKRWEGHFAVLKKK